MTENNTSDDSGEGCFAVIFANVALCLIISIALLKKASEEAYEKSVKNERKLELLEIRIQKLQREK